MNVEAACRRDLALRPDAALALEALGRAAGAIRWLARAVAVQPDFVAARINLAALLVEAAGTGTGGTGTGGTGTGGTGTGGTEGPRRARRALAPALALAPAEPAAWFNLGLACSLLPAHAAAEAAYARVLALDPLALDAACNRAALLTPAAPSRGEAALRRVLAVFPDQAPGLNALARLLQNGAEGPAAARWFRRAHLLRPADAALRGNWLLQLAYDPDLSPDLLLARHRRAMVPLAAPLAALSAPAPEPGAGEGRPLRVGFVSADLARHPVGFFLAPVLEARDPRALATVCYSGRRAGDGDAWTRRLRAACDLWVETAGLDDAGLAARIRADRIDLLIDLSGQTAGNRLAVFAARPAPVQASWMGYPGTTGLSQVDWLIADAAQIPPGSETGYAEQVLRLAPGYVCYAPPEDAPEVAPLPARRGAKGSGAKGRGTKGRGRFTFGSLNNLAKLNPAVFRLWAQVLDAVADSRLLLAWQSLGDPRVARRLRALAAEAGIPPDRLELRPGGAPAAFLAHYAEIDVALDPFPYSGGLTTLEALWMGVPVLTWPNGGFAGRHAASHLAQAGLADWIAGTQAAYVARAAAAAADPDSLAALRAGMRARLRASPLLDGAGFARRFEAACREMWRRRRSSAFSADARAESAWAPP